MSKNKRSVKEQMQNRTKQSHDTRDDYGVQGANYLDTSSMEDVKFYKVKKAEEGRNLIDIIPYEAGDKHPSVKKGDLDYVLDIWVHKNLGVSKHDSFVCMKNTFGKPCAVCDEVASMKESGDFDEDTIKALYPKRRAIYNVIDLKSDDSSIMLWDSAHPHTEKEIVQEAYMDGGEFIAFADTEEGKSIKFRGDHNEKFKYTKPINFSFVDRDEPYDEDIVDEAFSLDQLLVIPDYDYVKDVLQGVDVDEEEPSENVEAEVEEEEVVERKRDRKKKRDKKSEKQENKCPAKDGKFGEDCDKLDECDDCDEALWSACAKKSEESLD